MLRLPRIKFLHIERLQPIESEVELDRVAFYKNHPEKYRDSLPEVWYLNDDYVLADGHHKIFAKHLNGSLIIPVIYHSPYNTSRNYEYLSKEILERVKEVRRKGIFRIKQLCLVN